MVAARMFDYYAEQARERMSKGGGDKKSEKTKSGPANLPDPIPDQGDARDKAAARVKMLLAIATYLAQRDSVADYNAALLVSAKIRHRLGEVLRETVRHEGSRGVGNNVLPTLPEGVGKMQSSRAQQLASLPWHSIARRIDEATAQGRKARLGRIDSPTRTTAI